jgi:1-deoxy-D-xylulose-5-phosphate reductoisomerase
LKYVSILGVTGSIGTQTLDVIRKDKDKFNLVGISANTSYEKVVNIIDEFYPKYVAMMDKESFNKIKEYCREKNFDIEVLHGLEGLNTIATIKEVDIVVTSIVGMIGLIPTLKAIEARKNIALANKETLVVGGELVTKAARDNNVSILPVDSEHGAIFQCLQGNKLNEVHKIILTASGGPFRGRKIDELREILPEQALKHPKWNMGKKISIDSATLMNKGLEVIEAHWLFNVDYNDIEVLVHPQSIIHSMVEYIDGSVMAQLAAPDMRLPIQYALNYPDRSQSVIQRLDFYNIRELTFERPDLDTFKGLKLAFEAGKAGGLMPTILNAANEAVVELFLNYKIRFLDIPNIIEECMNKFPNSCRLDLEELLSMDKMVREFVYKRYGEGGI